MTCLDFRRQLLADPYRLNADLLEHQSACPACAAFAVRQGRIEEQLQESVRIPVPDGLADRILLPGQVRRTQRRTWLALAAGVVLATGSLAALWPMLRPAGFAEELLAHVAEHEPLELAIDRRGDPRVLANALSGLGLSLPAGLGEVRYLGRCPVPGGTGEHVIVQTPLGNVTLIVMPGQPLNSQVVMSGRGLHGVARPAGRGSYALLADSETKLAQLETLFR
jgi:hypothetical protein